MTLSKTNLLLIFLLFLCLPNYGQTKKKNNYLVSFTNPATDECGYKNQNGDIVIPPGKYSFCFTDTFRTFAIVAKLHFGFAAIDRHENILYEVFPYDNGPDYASDGLFRILETNKIGYADEVTGKVVIKPQFDCAFPFENDVAKVGFNCRTHSVGENYFWTSDNWFFIDKKGKKVKPPSSKE
ncbi:MAG: WG repeat-containing protein [Ginsengibacter sp.]